MPDLLRLFDDLVRVEIALWDAVDRRLRAELDAPLPFLEFLTVIHGRGTCRVGDIAADLGITVGGTSKTVDRLEARGLVARTPNPDDRRSSLLTETPAGRALRESATTILQAVLEARLTPVLSADALGTLASSLAALRAARPETAS
jgi:MarR family transcriptional regulator, organic hydroperoxide resistance regulator